MRGVRGGSLVPLCWKNAKISDVSAQVLRKEKKLRNVGV